MTAPVVVISSFDRHPVPAIPSAERLAERARAAGWFARSTYAAAIIPATYYAETHEKAGLIKKDAHRLETVVLWLARHDQRGRARWDHAGAGWSFGHAWLDLDQLNLKQLTERIMK